MLSLIYILLILVLNQSLYIVTNAQQDLEYQFLSTNLQPDVSTRSNMQTIYNSPHQEISFLSDFNYNKQNLKALPLFHSYYESLAPIAPEPTQTNIRINKKHNWNDVTEGRSSPIYRDIISSKEQPPVELHHGYRYITPAISFSNIENLKNVIYNELGLSENHYSLTSSPQGFSLRQPQAEFQNNINFAAQKPKNGTEITKFVNHRNSTNSTILTPVTNLFFSHNNAQSNVLKRTQHVNQFSMKHKPFTQEEKEYLFTNKPNVSYKYDGSFNPTSNLKTSGQLKTDNKSPQTLFQSGMSSNVASNYTQAGHLQAENNTTIALLNISNDQPNQKEISLNIRPSIEIFQNLQPVLSQSALRADDLASQTDYNKDLNKAHNQYFSQYENLKRPSKSHLFNNKQMVENTSQNNSSFSNPNIQSSYNILPSYPFNIEVFNGGSPQINRVREPFETSNQNFQNYKNQQKPAQNLPFNNNPIAHSEHIQDDAASQINYIPTQSVSYNTQVPNEQSFDNNDAKPVNQYISLNKNPSRENQQHTFIRPELSSNIKSNEFNLLHSGYQLTQHQLNKISNSGPNIRNQINNNQTNDSKKQNQIIFPTNVFLIDSTNRVTRLPIESNQYVYSKAQETNLFPTITSNAHNRYPEHNYHTSTISNHGPNNNFKLNDKNQIYADQPNKQIPQIATHANQLTNIYTFGAQQRPTFPVTNDHIDPRTADYIQSDEVPSNKTPIVYNTEQHNYQPKTSMVFPKMSNENLRLPHLIYGPPT